ncbi:contact-dependent growth inhibition system immunity protein [Moraxella pluranimalium]|uniref:DUF1436 domain-containing protein n=1 Tax=Moraxella pluranimalium TaxID=470453 RepID=A0A1T0CKY6_9GAMM|nr:contact-dependent growth inhibition system immunity protein [Moraxella pluranimalium]OOS23010.1 hypothetical protein B0680_08465 [Moraxella pluranimalium]
MVFNQEQYYSAFIGFNETAIIIQTQSGNGLLAIDYMYQPHVLPLDIDDNMLGETLLKSLSSSRTLVLDSEEIIDFFDLTKGKERYENWVDYLHQSLDYKSKKALFKNMMSCSISLFNGMIEIAPSRHVKLHAWEGLDDDKTITLPLDSTSDEIGKGLRLAMSYCL